MCVCVCGGGVASGGQTDNGGGANILQARNEKTTVIAVVSVPG